MWIAITSKGKELNMDINPCFGRCPYFIFYDMPTGQFKALKNPNRNLKRDAGVRAAQMIMQSEAKVLLTDNIGPNAFKTLSSAGIKVFANVSGKVTDVILQYIGGILQSNSNPSVTEYYGLHSSEGDYTQIR